MLMIFFFVISLSLPCKKIILHFNKDVLTLLWHYYLVLQKYPHIKEHAKILQNLSFTIINTCNAVLNVGLSNFRSFLYPPQTKFLGLYRNHLVCPSVCLSRVNLTLIITY